MCGQVALLFLTRLWLPYELVWKEFLSAVPALGEGPDQGWQQLFSLHVHLPPNHFFNQESIFKGREVEDRMAVEWGQWSVVSHAAFAFPHVPCCVADPVQARYTA